MNSFLEKFAISSNRGALLEQLLPGSESYFYFHALHLLNENEDGKYDKDLDSLMKRWKKAHCKVTETNQYTQLAIRKLFVEYDHVDDKKRKKIMEQIGTHLQLDPIHSAVVPPTQKSSVQQLPDTLDQNLVSWKKLSSSTSLNDFEHNALPLLASSHFKAEQMSVLWNNLQYPNVADLASLVAPSRSSKSFEFGQYNVHRLMTLDQLDEVLKKFPGVIDNQTFCNYYIDKLCPSEGIDLDSNWEAKEQYHARLYQFLQQLPHSFNNMKLSLLCSMLKLGQEKGEYSEDLFLEYLRLPKHLLPYMSESYYKKTKGQAAYGTTVGLLPAASNDVSLVKDYLSHLLLERQDIKPFQMYLEEGFLKKIFAETKLLSSDGKSSKEMEKWYTMMGSHEEVKKLEEQVKISFPASNPKFFLPESTVTIECDIKNCPTLLVKVFEMNTYNYYRETKKEISPSIDLDGLIAKEETVYTFTEPPLRVVRQQFTFPSIQGRGVFVVEFIGNGHSSRMVVFKGNLRYVERIGPAGHVFTVLDERNNKLNGASIWLSGHNYTADQHSEIVIPFSSAAGKQQILIRHNGFTTLSEFNHLSEVYSMQCSVYVNSESVLKDSQAKILIRPRILLHNTPLRISLLENATILISCIDKDQTPLTKTIPEVSFQDDQDYLCQFVVTEHITRVSVTVSGHIKMMGQGEQKFSCTESVDVNAEPPTRPLKFEHLIHNSEGYHLQVLGKNGEPIPGHIVNVSFKHQLVKPYISAKLQTNLNGLIHLGPLQDIQYVNASKGWKICADSQTYPTCIYTIENEPIHVPYSGGSNGDTSFENYALFESNSKVQGYLKNHSEKLAFSPGIISVQGLAVGRYNLYLRQQNITVEILVLPNGKRIGNYLASNRLVAESTHKLKPLHIVDASVSDKHMVQVRVSNWDDRSRVHVIATSFVPNADPFQKFLSTHRTTVNAPREFKREKVHYLPNRRLGDEYRYILDRKYAKVFPGNMLPAPELLANSWPVNDTHTSVLEMEGGTSFESNQYPENIMLSADMMAKRRSAPLGQSLDTSSPTLDWLKEPTVVLHNLEPDDKGMLSIPLSQFGDKSNVYILAVNDHSAAQRSVALPPKDPLFAARDLKFPPSLAFDSKKHFTESHLITAVPSKKVFTMQSATSKYQVYSNLGKIFDLYYLQTSNETLKTFEFIKKWNQLDLTEKVKTYSTYSCHELNYFLFRKDNTFFNQVVLPHLLNKHEKTFLDKFFLGEALDEHTQPYPWTQLNTTEKILLAQKVPCLHSSTAQYIKNNADLLPFDLQTFQRAFLAGLKSQSIEQDQRQRRGGALEPMQHDSLGYAAECAEEGEYYEEPSNASYSGCFVKGTLVNMANKRMKPIEDICVGDLVQCFDFSSNSIQSSRVLQLSSPRTNTTVRISFSSGTQVENTLDHPFFVKDKGWCCANPLANKSMKCSPLIVGDHCMALSALQTVTTWDYVTAMEFIHHKVAIPTYNLSHVDTYLNFFVSGVLVHNKRTKQTARKSTGGKAPRKRLREQAKVMDDEDEEDEDMYDEDMDYDRRQSQARRSYYQPVEKTKEYAETQYYQNQAASASLVQDNAFWAEYAAHSKGEFVSSNFILCTRNFTEMMFAMSVLDVPFEEGEKEVKSEGINVQMVHSSPVIIFHKEIKQKEVKEESANSTILVSQNYLDGTVQGRELKYLNSLTNEFQVSKVYGCHVAITNTLSSPQKINALLQLPIGAIPVGPNSTFTQSTSTELHAYQTKQQRYEFYFPSPGDFRHFPVHVSNEEEIIAFARDTVLHVVTKLSTVDLQSWDYISSEGSDDQLLSFLHKENLQGLSLEAIAWRMKDKELFIKVLEALKSRRVFNVTLWSYSLFHGEEMYIKEYLPSQTQLAKTIGAKLHCNLLHIDPFEFGIYKHLEYKPLINPRAHVVGKQKQILNQELERQYSSFLSQLCYSREFAIWEQLELVYYLLLQNRVEEATNFFKSMDYQKMNVEASKPRGEVPSSPGKTEKKRQHDSMEIDSDNGSTKKQKLSTLSGFQLQHDYLKAFLNFYNEDLKSAQEIALKYQDYPIQMWRDKFSTLKRQLEEILHGTVTETSADQASLVATEPSLQLSVESRKIQLEYQNIDQCTVSFYLMDIELLFSSNPFVKQQLGQFAYITPNEQQVYDLPKDKTCAVFTLPEKFHNSNVIVDVNARGIQRSQVYFSHSLRVHLVENYGQVRVMDSNGKPLPRAYVKVYSKLKDGNVIFFKDGYTDLRGYFDFASLSTDQLATVDKFSMLVMTDNHGSLIQEANPPKQ